MQIFDWPTLFLGAFLDALIGANLIVPGEPFLIAAGYQLQQGIYSGLIAVLFAGWIGDQCSFFIGQRYGSIAQRKLIAWQPWLNRYFARARLLMRQSGNKVILFARLFGPVAWIVPFIAGTQKVSWQRFTFFATFGLILGVGQFVLWGYLLAMGVENIPWLNSAKNYLTNNKLTLLVLAIIVMALFVGLQFWRRRKLSKIDTNPP